MKLRFSPISPFVRKVLVFAHETGLADRIDLVATNPRDEDSDLGQENPLRKIPSLVTDGGEALYDSRVICEYLDGLHDGLKLFPAAAGERLAALRLQALADGILDAAILRIYEGQRPQNYRSPDWDAIQKGKVTTGLNALEEQVDGFGDAMTIGLLSVGCVLGYLDFRFADDNWRGQCPALADWFEPVNERPSMTATMPKLP
ncbi:MAG TPA: glutathione S-transferase [Rhodospirillales bacterium]|nr:glutathione S-transferase [Rhodospirillales bacterium]